MQYDGEWEYLVPDSASDESKLNPETQGYLQSLKKEATLF